MEGSSPLVWDAKHLRIATDAAGIALWSWNVDTDTIAMDARAHALWGVPRSNRQITFEDLSACIHPEDLDRVRKAFQATREILGAYDIDFRIMHQGQTRWVSARGQGDDLGIVGRIMFGVFLDVTERMRVQENQDLLAGEMSHRVKNLFALAAALAVIAERSAATPAEMKTDLTQRLQALGRAHDLVRPLSAAGKADPALLGDLLGILLAPYAEPAGAGNRLSVHVQAVPVGAEAATALSLVVHELATNSIKYGALSAPGGSIAMRSSTSGEDDLVVSWIERGGPAVTPPGGRSGYGSKLIAQTMKGRLGGTIDFEWPPQGMVARLRMSRGRLGH